MKDIYFITGIIANLGITYGIFKFFNFTGKVENMIMHFINKKSNVKVNKSKELNYSPEAKAVIETSHQRNVMRSNPIWLGDEKGISICQEKIVEERLRRISDITDSDTF